MAEAASDEIEIEAIGHGQSRSTNDGECCDRLGHPDRVRLGLEHRHIVELYR
jgi:hypothetical protein